MEYRCRLYREDDLEGIWGVMADYFPPEALKLRKKFFLYIASKNPCLKEKIPYCVIEHDGRIIGYLGQMPIQFVVSGELHDGYYAHDILLLEEYRGKGIAQKLIRFQKETFRSLFAALWFSSRNHKAYQIVGWTDILGLKPFRNYLKSDIWLFNHLGRRKVPRVLSLPFDLFLRIRDLKVKEQEKTAYQIKEIESFDYRIDEFVDRASKDYGIIMRRGSELLNWKYVNNKAQTYSKFAVMRGSSTEGYVVLRVRQEDGFRVGTVVDFLANSTEIDSFRALIRHSLNFFRKRDVSVINVLTTQPILIKELYRVGFLRSRSALPFMTTNWQGIWSENFITNVRNWYITFGDSDFGLWAPD